jgi:predicted ATPase/DNA-binding CsgD family transcriptional regulator
MRAVTRLKLHRPEVLSARLFRPPRLIGRAGETAQLISYLLDERARFVTVAGVEGVGKTALAADALARLGAAFDDGVARVDLASSTRPDQLLPALAEALGLNHGGRGASLRDAVYEWLAFRKMLLLLDHVDHHSHAGAELVDLLAACKGVAALITSREPLGLCDERALWVPRLAAPDQQQVNATPTRQLLSWPAVALFVERAREQHCAFALTSDNAPAITQICARLEGLPLAIELAAARSHVLTPSEILMLLNRRRLPTVVSGRLPAARSTARETIEWSYQLLSHEEQVLFRRLAVFVGGGTLASIAAVVDPSPTLEAVRSVSDWSPSPALSAALQSLVDKHLVKREQTGSETRLRMLESVREHALQRLAAHGEGPAIRARHAAYWSARVRHLDSAADQTARARFLEGDRDNIRAALRWSVHAGDRPPSPRTAAPRCANRRRTWTLTSREQEIALLVARGWTNQHIAEYLVLSSRTVETHVSHILDKLDFNSRAQIAVWASQHQQPASAVAREAAAS